MTTLRTARLRAAATDFALVVPRWLKLVALAKVEFEENAVGLRMISE